MKRSVIVFISIASIAIAAALGSGIYMYKNILNIDTIYIGVTIDGYDVKNKTMEQALEYIKDKKETQIKDKSMNLIYEQKVYKINLDQIGFSYDYDKAVKTAFKLGRQGNFINRLKDIKKIKDGIELPLESSYEYEKIESIVNDISQEINRESVEATFDFNKGNIKVSDEVIGRKVLKDDLTNKIEENIFILKDIDIPVENIQPRLTKAFLSKINGVIGEFSTSFKGSSKGRIENIKLSANAISNKLIFPGEEISYNNLTGPRSAQSGYQEANVIIGGELTPGLGGGVCQTSTTMYNALLLSDMTILERHPHSIPANYVPYGQDAAVAYGYLDLKFKNDFDFPIYTYAKIIGDTVSIYIYGDLQSKNYIVKIKPEIVETIYANTKEMFDETLMPGTKIDIQKGRTGYKVNTYKSIIKDGKVISKNNITTDNYKKKDYIYKIGPKIEPDIETGDEGD